MCIFFKFRCKNVLLKRDVCQLCVTLKTGKRHPFYIFSIQFIDGNWYLAICWQTSSQAPNWQIYPSKSVGLIKYIYLYVCIPLKYLYIYCGSRHRRMWTLGELLPLWREGSASAGYVVAPARCHGHTANWGYQQITFLCNLTHGILFVIQCKSVDK